MIKDVFQIHENSGAIQSITATWDQRSTFVSVERAPFELVASSMHLNLGGITELNVGWI